MGSDPVRKATCRDTVARRILTRVRVDEHSGCWNFIGAKTAYGYGIIVVNGRGRFVHRLLYQMFYGPLREGYQMHHECHNRLCCNPLHLVPVTPAEHQIALTPGALAYEGVRKTHCKYGHPLSGDNVFRSPLRPQHRICLACRTRRALVSNAVRTAKNRARALLARVEGET